MRPTNKTIERIIKEIAIGFNKGLYGIGTSGVNFKSQMRLLLHKIQSGNALEHDIHFPDSKK